jgi:deazaflavin-dependent oxidoreductase (nitroreductase family)
MADKKYLRPPFILSKIINPFIMALGLMTVLRIKGRKSGKWIKVPVIPIEYNNQTYLVAPRGETQWARNLRKNTKGTLTEKRKTRNFTATEISGNLQMEVVKFYQEKVPGVKSQFQALPNPKDHPAFRLEFNK